MLQASGDQNENKLPHETSDGGQHSSKYINGDHAEGSAGTDRPAPNVQVQHSAGTLTFQAELLLHMAGQPVDVRSNPKHEYGHDRHEIPPSLLQHVHHFLEKDGQSLHPDR